MVLIEEAGCVADHFATVTMGIYPENNSVVESSAAYSQLTVNREGHLHCPREESPPNNLLLRLDLDFVLHHHLLLHHRLPDAVAMLSVRRVTAFSEK